MTEISANEAYRDLQVYYGDLHNHCNIGYAHGSIEDAFHNARLQLDFFCMTAHGCWHDLPAGEARLAEVVAYHQEGFRRAAAGWPHLKALVAAGHEDGNFVTFLGFEWHSRYYGDHTVYFKGAEGEILCAADMPALRERLREYRARGIETMLMPHHIGYKAGYRGINWEAFDEEFAPLVEIMSMHGVAESHDAPYPYLHTMGPRDWRSTLQYGLAQGHRVGVVGSTDHHSAHPGSYGHGRTAVWARELTRDGVWEALQARRTYALTGDRIRLQFSLNNQPMGSPVRTDAQRDIELAVEGGAALDMIEVLHNNRVFHRWCLEEREFPDPFAAPLKIHLELGWGEREAEVDWEAELRVVDGALVELEPRFRGREIVAPQEREESSYAFSDWRRMGEDGVAFTTRTWGNPTTTTAGTQGMGFTIQATPGTRLVGKINGRAVDQPVADLLAGPRAHYLSGFLSPAYYFHRAAPRHEYATHLRLIHHSESAGDDWYYVRVRQRNGQCAWSSPIWVMGEK